MKASELRIGNLLRDKVTKTELKVIELTEKDIVTRVIDRSKFPLKDGWGIEPIPLTEEWLLKFGFVKHGKYGYFYIDFFIVDLDMNGQFYMCDIDIHIVLKHVHQLQNLYFACTGEELTLEP